MQSSLCSHRWFSAITWLCFQGPRRARRVPPRLHMSGDCPLQTDCPRPMHFGKASSTLHRVPHVFQASCSSFFFASAFSLGSVFAWASTFFLGSVFAFLGCGGSFSSFSSFLSSVMERITCSDDSDRPRKKSDRSRGQSGGKGRCWRSGGAKGLKFVKDSTNLAFRIPQVPTPVKSCQINVFQAHTIITVPLMPNQTSK